MFLSFAHLLGELFDLGYKLGESVFPIVDSLLCNWHNFGGIAAGSVIAPFAVAHGSGVTGLGVIEGQTTGGCILISLDSCSVGVGAWVLLKAGSGKAEQRE